jgi:hypothetical protein
VGFDTQDDMGLMAVVNMGLSADTLSGTNKIELSWQESDDNATFTAVADADMTGPVTGTATGTFAVVDDPAEDETCYKSGYKGNKRYARVNINFSGTHTNGTPMSVTYHGLPMKLPA